MSEKRKVTLKGKAFALTGDVVNAGDKAPDFRVVDEDLKQYTLKDFSGKIKVISVTPSLDTPVCDLQAHRFNDEAGAMPEDVVVLNISMDLPFAIKRFCMSGEVSSIKVFSDHKEASFGKNWGVLVEDLRVLARAVFVVDKDDVIRYIEIVSEIGDHPDYDKALDALKELFG
ncbi:MAG: thiol peroxidase [Thermovirgaceae bacterium]